jgi:hypothetical protein
LRRSKLRAAGRKYGEAREAYQSAKRAAAADLPLDEEGKAKIVCRRYAERRAVRIDGEGRPECFEAGHADCEGCAEDVRDRQIETW